MRNLRARWRANRFAAEELVTQQLRTMPYETVSLLRRLTGLGPVRLRRTLARLDHQGRVEWTFVNTPRPERLYRLRYRGDHRAGR